MERRVYMTLDKATKDIVATFANSGADINAALKEEIARLKSGEKKYREVGAK